MPFPGGTGPGRWTGFHPHAPLRLWALGPSAGQQPGQGGWAWLAQAEGRGPHEPRGGGRRAEAQRWASERAQASQGSVRRGGGLPGQGVSSSPLGRWRPALPTDQPDNPSEENCGVIRTESSGGWQNRDCSIALPYVCKKKPNATAAEPPPPGEWGGRGWWEAPQATATAHPPSEHRGLGSSLFLNDSAEI